MASLTGWLPADTDCGWELVTASEFGSTGFRSVVRLSLKRPSLASGLGTLTRELAPSLHFHRQPIHRQETVVLHLNVRLGQAHVHQELTGSGIEPKHRGERLIHR